MAVRIRNECEINVKWPVINPGRLGAIKQKMNTTSLIKQKVCLASSLGDSRLSRDLSAPLCPVFVPDNFSKACVYYFSPEHKGMSRNNALCYIADCKTIEKKMTRTRITFKLTNRFQKSNNKSTTVFLF